MRDAYAANAQSVRDDGVGSRRVRERGVICKQVFEVARHCRHFAGDPIRNAREQVVKAGREASVNAVLDPTAAVVSLLRL